MVFLKVRLENRGPTEGAALDRSGGDEDLDRSAIVFKGELDLWIFLRVCLTVRLESSPFSPLDGVLEVEALRAGRASFFFSALFADLRVGDTGGEREGDRLRSMTSCVAILRGGVGSICSSSSSKASSHDDCFGRRLKKEVNAPTSSPSASSAFFPLPFFALPLAFVFAG